MSRLSADDLFKAIECIQSLLVAKSLNEFTAMAIRVMAPLVQAKVASYNEVDPPRGRFGFAVYPPDILSDEALAIWTRHAHENPLIQHVHENPTDFGVYKITDFVRQEQFRKTGLCRKLYKGLIDAEYQIAMPFPEPGTAAIAIAFNRATDFTERDRELLTLLQPLVVRAYRNAAAFTDLQMAHEDIRQSFDGLQPGLIMVAGDGTILAQSLKAREFLHRLDARTRGPAAVLPDAITSWLDQDSKGSSPDSSGQTLRLRIGKRQLAVTRIARSKDRSIVLSVKESAGAADDAFRKFRLTHREAEIVTWLARGESNKQIARRLGVRSRTIEKHIEHILPKLKVTSRTAACLLAASLSGEVSG